MDRLKQLELQFLELLSLNIPSLCNKVYDKNGHLYLGVRSQETKFMKSSDVCGAKLPNMLTIAKYNVWGLETAMDILCIMLIESNLSFDIISLTETFTTDISPIFFF